MWKRCWGVTIATLHIVFWSFLCVHYTCNKGNHAQTMSRCKEGLQMFGSCSITPSAPLPPAPLKHHSLMERSWPSCALCSPKHKQRAFRWPLHKGTNPKKISLHRNQSLKSLRLRCFCLEHTACQVIFMTIKLDFNGTAKETARRLKPWLQTEEGRQNMSWGLLHLGHLPAHLMWLSSKTLHSSTWLKGWKLT